MEFVNRIARLIWGSWIKELVLFIVTAATLVVVAQLAALDALFEDGVSLSDFAVWGPAAGAALLQTALRQGIAWIVARAAGSRL